MRVINDKYEVIFDLLKLKNTKDNKEFGNFILNIKNCYRIDEKQKKYSIYDGFFNDLSILQNKILEKYNKKEISNELIYNLQLELIQEFQNFIDEKQEDLE